MAVAVSCGILRQNKLWPKPAELDRPGGSGGFRMNFFFTESGGKPCPARVLQKWTSQNLVFKELRYQNLENKQLSGAGFALGGPSLPRP